MDAFALRDRLIGEYADYVRNLIDKLHVYRGRQGADVAMRRLREAFAADRLRCVGTSATLSMEGSHSEQRAEVARVVSALFGAPVDPDQVIGETLCRTAPRGSAGCAFRGRAAA